MKTNRGVTLIELLIASTVLAVVFGAVLGIFNFSTRQLGAQTSRSEAIMFANQAVDAMAKEIRNAVSVQTDSQGALSVFTLPANTDSSGNYVPVSQNGRLTYGAGLQIHFHLSDSQGSAQSGTNLWREYWNPGGLLGLGAGWVPDTAWSQQPGGSATKYPNVTALTFSSAGLPANTIRVSVTMAIKEGKQTAGYTVSRVVYLSKHN